MPWLKQKDETYIKQETTQVVNLSILKREIEELENQIKELEKELLPYPKGADERLKQAVDMYNMKIEKIGRASCRERV